MELHRVGGHPHRGVREEGLGHGSEGAIIVGQVRDIDGAIKEHALGLHLDRHVRHHSALCCLRPYLGKAPQPFDDGKVVLHPGAHLGLVAVLASLAHIDLAVAAYALVGEVLC
jgi:hypothetical protein